MGELLRGREGVTKGVTKGITKWVTKEMFVKGGKKKGFHDQTETSKQPIRTRYLGHETGYQPIRDQYFLSRSGPAHKLGPRRERDSKHRRCRNRPIRTRYLGHVTGYQPIRDQYFLIRSIPRNTSPCSFCVSLHLGSKGGSGLLSTSPTRDSALFGKLIMA
eukprot:sb/3472852/